MKKIICLISMLVVLFCIGSVASAADNLYAVSVDGELSLYISPDEESYKIISIPACSKLRLIETQQTWGLVEFDGKSGWVNMSYTRSSYDEAAEMTGNSAEKDVKISSSEKMTVLYNVPSTQANMGAKEKYKVPNGTTLKVIRETVNGWGLVSMHGEYAWVQMKDTRLFETEINSNYYGIFYAYVVSHNGKGAELWETPERTSVVTIIPDCVRLTISETQNGYGKVHYNRMDGYIELSCLTETLSNAQTNSGELVNVECVVDIKGNDGDGKAELWSVPSEDEAAGAAVVGTVKNDTAVFAMRRTMGDWILINHKGNLGWIKEEFLNKVKKSKTDIVSALTQPGSGFVLTKNKKGMKIYATQKGELEVATIPECTNVAIIAQEGEYIYVYCDYASGWAKKDELVATFAETLASDHMKKKVRYVLKDDAVLMSNPTDSALCKSAVITNVGKDSEFLVLKIVTTGKIQWGLTEIDGKLGWINLENAIRPEMKYVMLGCGIALTAIFILIVIVAVKLVKKRKNKKNDQIIEEVDENGNEASEVLSDEGSESYEEAADVPCK
ncbi:MAG: SH3-like domain-containing protein [Clostridia bacterium]|nr:SH3-like domain-containing protein [Clostridia bacterium]